MPNIDFNAPVPSGWWHATVLSVTEDYNESTKGWRTYFVDCSFSIECDDPNAPFRT